MNPKIKIVLIITAFVIIITSLAYGFQGRLGGGNLGGARFHQSADSALCKESDGGFNIFRKSQTAVTNGSLDEDRCEDESYLTEYSCIDGEARKASVRCPKGTSCADGRCRR